MTGEKHIGSKFVPTEFFEYIIKKKNSEKGNSLSGGERDEKINGRDLPRDDVLGTQVSREIAKNLL
jgi:hypothetical protein